MIITKSEPFTSEEIEKISELFGTYVKTVIDVNKKVCSAGCDRHFDSEQILLESGSRQNDLWGGGIDAKTKSVDFSSMINIRPSQNNPTNEILDQKLRETYEELTKFFFREIL